MQEAVAAVRLRLTTSVFFRTSKPLNEEEKPEFQPLVIWRRIGRIVRMLCAVCIALRKYAMEAGLMENYMVSVATRRTHSGDADTDAEELCFNLSDFRISKEVKVPRALAELMDKIPSARSAEDVHAIATLMRDLPSFRKYTKDMQTLMSGIVRYMKCGRRRVVLRKGHVGFSVYFIYSGSVSVVLDKDEESIFVKPEVVTLRKGACFGEIALMQNTRRNATIVCAEDSEFLVIDKEDFLDNGLDLQMKEEFKHRSSFYRRWEPLSHWSDEEVNNLSYVSRTEDFNHNRVIVKDSRTNEFLWFVVQGSCDILRLVDLEQSPDYERILAYRQASSDKYMTYTDSSAHRSIHQRAHSAPNKLHCHSLGQSHSRPRTSLGISPSFIKEEDEEDEEEDEEEEGREYSSGDDEEAEDRSVVNGSMESVSRARRRSSKLSSAVNSLVGRNALLKKPEDENVRNGIYVKVDTIRDGACFGLEALYDEDQGQRYSMVSKGCTLIHIPRSRFKELADNKCLQNIKKLLKTYPSDTDLCHGFLKKSEWDSFKHDMVEEVVAKFQTVRCFQNGLKHCVRKEHGQKCEEQQSTSLVYTPLTSQSYSPLIGSYGTSPAEMKSIKSKKIQDKLARVKRPRTAFAKISNDVMHKRPGSTPRGGRNQNKVELWQALDVLQSPGSRGDRHRLARKSRSESRGDPQESRLLSRETVRQGVLPRPCKVRATKLGSEGSKQKRAMLLESNG